MRSKFLVLPAIAVLLLLSSCKNSSSSSSRQTGNSDLLQTSPTYTVEPLLLGNGQITSLATFSTTLFWSDDHFGDGIWKYDRGDSGDPVLLVPRIRQPKSLVIRGNFFYWIDSIYGTGKKLLYQTSLDGSETTLLHEGNNLQSTTSVILVDDEAVYWANGAAYSSPAQIERVPLDGSDPQAIYTASREIRSLATDGDFIYWLEGVVNADSGTYTLFRISKTGGFVETLYERLLDGGCTGIDQSVNIVVDSTYVYLGLAGKIVKIPVAGGAASVLLQSTEVCPRGSTVFGANFYWLNYSSYGSQAYGGSSALLSLPTDTSGSLSVISANLGSAQNIHANATGLYWDESQTLKRRLWGAVTDDILADGIYFWSSDIAGNYLYFAEFIQGWQYSRIGRISLTTGTQESVIGGLNSDSATLIPATDYLIFGDGTALKKVPMVGGKTETLMVNGVITFDHIYEKDGQVFFSSGGIYKIPLAGGNATLIANDIGAEKIISVQDGYVYYVWFPSSGTWGGALAELHRVPVDGGTPEVVYRTQPGRYLAAFDGITTVYLEEWIWNDQYKFLMIDIATGKEVHLLSGTFRFLGVNRDAVFIDDMNGRVSRIPKDGGTATNNLNVPYPLTLDPYWINAGVEDFYFSISYLDDAQGYVSEIDLLKRLQ